MTDILQTRLPYDPVPRPLPGIAPLDMADWLIFDDAFAAQMAERDRLLAGRRDAVLALDPAARPAAQELLQMVLDRAYPDAVDVAHRRDGTDVPIDRDDPLATLGRLVQQDFCILEKRDGSEEHILTGAVLCFPARWALGEKFMRPLTVIHVPVDPYDAEVAKRVQRLFDGIRVGRPLWRYNVLRYADATLFQPMRAAGRGPEQRRSGGNFLRSERQSLLRLPDTGAVVFGIHTFVLAADAGDATPA